MAITARAVADRIQHACGVGWRASDIDGFIAGNPDAPIRGVATCFAPSLEVLHKAVAAGKTMIVSLESPFWTRPAALVPGGTSPTGDQEGPPGYKPLPAAPGAGGGGGGAAPQDSDPLFREKRDYIAAHNLVIYRFTQNWSARQPDPQLGALVKALGYGGCDRPARGVPWSSRGAAFVALPPATLRTTAIGIKTALKLRGGLRIVGHADTRVTKAAVKPGIALLVDLERYFAEPGVDLVIMGEAIWENEGMQYAADLVASGQKKGLILLGEAMSQDPGCGAMAAWIRSLVSEVPVDWIPTSDPSWMPA